MKADVEDELDSLSSIFSRTSKWLVNQFNKLIEIRKDQLNSKCKKDNYPICYWVEAPQHENFANNLSRRKFNSSLQAEISVMKNMRIMRMKKIWDPEDSQLYLGNSSRLTTSGIFKYWSSIDNALQFNDSKAVKFEQRKQTQKGRPQFQTKFKWSKDQRNQRPTSEDSNYRFKLPRPKRLDFN